VKQDRPTWPRIGYDMSGEIERVTQLLKRRCQEVEFIPALAHGAEDAKRLLAAHEADCIDGYIVYQMNNWVQVMQTIVASGKPTLVADFIYAGSGGFLVYTATLSRQYKNFSAVASSDLEDLAAAARCFVLLKRGNSPNDFAAAADEVRQRRTAKWRPSRCKEDQIKIASVGKCLEEMKQARMLVVGQPNQTLGQEIEQCLGIQTEFLDFSELKAAYEKTNRDQALELVTRWQKTAKTIKVENVDDTLEKSARSYLAQQAVMNAHRAEAITINCLGGFYGGHLTAYPCLGFVELLNDGLVGACEADMKSTATMIAMNHLVGRPGYISDPVLDTSRRQIIYAHCVASTKMFGPAGDANRFEILSHAEDQRGASVRSFLPLGYMTSTMQIHPSRREILFHRAKAVDNVVIDRACRTKLAGEVVGDAEKLFTYWDQYGWHRVTFYGDLREPVKELATALKFQFIEEA